MKIFIDTANIEEIKKYYEMGIIDGVTTNPSLIAKENKPFKEIISDIVKVVDGPISVEATAEKAEDIIKQGIEYSKIHKNIVVKVAMNAEGLKAIKELTKKNIKTNCTLIFSANQALLAAKAGATYASVFVGRLDDAGNKGMDVIRDTMEIFYNFEMTTELISASIRNPIHVIESAKAGADIATIPFDVLDKMIKHPLTDKGIEKFLEDWK
ncbi:MAG: fructose-6-phosphate aldolase, partial [Candidatus Diapherotrites archaeon CG10_big_fil_rev_8_21_14_0_10_31_34]